MLNLYSPIPVLALVAQNIALTLIVRYTSPRSRLLRFICLCGIVCLGYVEFITASWFSSNVPFNLVLGGPPFTNLLLCIDLLFLDPAAPSEAPGFFLLLSQRGLNTRWLTKNVPKFPSYYNTISPKPPGSQDSRNGKSQSGMSPAKAEAEAESNPNPDRFSFLMRQTAIFIWQYLLIDLIMAAGSKQSPEEMHELYGPGTEYLFFSATREQLIARIATSVIAWMVVSRLTIDGVHRGFSIVAVGLGISEPKDWAPLFGSMLDAYTIRNYWGKFWHQMLRWPLTAISTYTTRHLLRLRHPSLPERYLNILLVFTLSALLHILSNHAGGVTTNDTGVALFFILPAFGIMFEDGVQELWRRTRVETYLPRGVVGVVKRGVGYVWLMGFLSVTGPWFLYAMNRLPMEVREGVPVSVVRMVGEGKVAGTLAVGAVVLVVVFKARL
ncbi:hypothetical protein FQN55_008085 [Onygenales sp. PD_40]|nr:hypothetical protein FQN55_008085 [Onygenales sp. PD_40]